LTSWDFSSVIHQIQLTFGYYTILFLLFIKIFKNLFILERESGERELGRDSQRISSRLHVSVKPDSGLHPMALRSQPELKSIRTPNRLSHPDVPLLHHFKFNSQDLAEIRVSFLQLDKRKD